MENKFDYEQVLMILDKINEIISKESFDEGFGEKSDELRSLVVNTTDMAKEEESPSKIKDNIDKIKGLVVSAHGVITLAKEIYDLIELLTIKKLP